jgi:hypothetical protein
MKSLRAAMALLFVGNILSPQAWGDSTIDASNSYAYAANAGWVNCRGNGVNGVVVGEYVLSGYAWAANVGWINFGSGAPANGIRYQNGSASDFGVNQDGQGNLSGYAWGANIGWINFGWAASNDANRPRFDLTTGQFSGYAYGANVGWIKLGSGYLLTNTVHMTDSDGDGIADEWEMEHFGNLTTANATSDFNHDGITDKQAYLAGTDPTNAADDFHLLSQVYDAVHQQFTLQFSSKPTRLYRIQVSADLINWSDSGLGTFAPDSGTTTTRVVNITGGAHFFRAVAVKPLE